MRGHFRQPDDSGEIFGGSGDMMASSGNCKGPSQESGCGLLKGSSGGCQLVQR